MPSRSNFSALATKFLDSTFSDFVRDIDIVEEINTSDGQGGQAVELITFANTEGFAFPMDGNEAVKNGGVYTDKMYKFSMQPVSEMTNKMLIKYTDRDAENYYEIISINNIADAGVWVSVIAKKREII